MEQLAIDFKTFDERGIGRFLSRACGRPVSIKVTDNLTRMISVRPSPVTGGWEVRLHRIFLGAGLDVLEELARFIRKRCRTPLVNAFIREKGPEIREGKQPKAQKVNARGKFFDLKAVYDKINSGYFNGKINAAITWGKRPSKKSARKKTLGSYSFVTNTIRINLCLDRDSVPEFYVEFIVYHEMLHAFFGPSDSKRRSYHHREFREKERGFRGYKAATEWEKKVRF